LILSKGIIKLLLPLITAGYGLELNASQNPTPTLTRKLGYKGATFLDDCIQHDAYNDEVIPWRRSNHLMGTRSFPSSDDSYNDSSGMPYRTGTEKTTN
jgi:hypothetical protein